MGQDKHLLDFVILFSIIITLMMVYSIGQRLPDGSQQMPQLRHISGLTAFVNGSTANLTIFDQGDPEGGGLQTIFNRSIYFYANYTNSTSGAAIDDAVGNCTIEFADMANTTMFFDSMAGWYWFSRDFQIPGTALYNISCFAAGYDTLNATDNLTIQCGYLNSNFAQASNITINNSDCYIINASNIALDCGGNSIAGNNIATAIRTEPAASNVTIQNCAIRRFVSGIRIYSNQTTAINNTISDAGIGAGSIRGIEAYSENNTITNNALRNLSSGEPGAAAGIYLNGANFSSISSNNISDIAAGIRTSSSSNMSISNNTFRNVQTLVDISGSPEIIDVLFNSSYGSLDYRNISFNGTLSSSMINISPNVLAVNTSANPSLNSSATACINFTGSCSVTPSIYYTANFSTSLSTILSTGSLCTLSSDPSCSVLSCSGNRICFNVIHFSAFGVANVTSCGVVNGDIMLGQNLAADGTCFTINASNIILDCKGYNITGNSTGAGVNSTNWNNITIKNCAFSNFNSGVLLQGTNNSFVQNTAANASALGLGMVSSSYNTVAGSSFSSSATAASMRSASENNSFTNTALEAGSDWISVLSSPGNNITSTLFGTSSGSIRIQPAAALPSTISISPSKLDITSNNAFLNSSNLTFLNLSARITLTGLAFINPKPTADFADNGTFADCPLSICTEVSYASGTYIFDVTHFTSYSSAESFIAQPSAAPEAPRISHPSPTLPLKEIQPPVLPKYDNVRTSLDPKTVSPSSRACVLVDKMENVGAITELTPSPGNLKLAEQQQVIQAFKAKCTKNLDVTLNLPDNFKDIKAYRCDLNSCAEVAGSSETRLSCGKSFFADLSRKTVLLEPKDFPLELRKTSIDSQIQMMYDGFRLIFAKPATAALEAPDFAVNEPANRFARIVGTPIIVSSAEMSGSTRIILPYKSAENIDEASIALYAYKYSGWQYIGGDVDFSSSTVAATADLSSYAQDNKVLIAPIGTFCFNCISSKLTRFYNGTGRDAVILIHGLELAPGRLQDIMNDIALTNQPWQGWVFQYLPNKSMEENAKDLAALLEANSDKFDYVYIAAHSMGGIVAQEALKYADEQNKKRFQFTFLPKVRKVVVIATPNKGVIREGIYKELFEFLINNNLANEIFNFNSQVIRELVQGKTVERVNGIEYFAVAGTKPYDFVNIGEVNDGIVTVGSAQYIGGKPASNRCADFWDIYVSHTDILNEYDSRKIVERIVANEVADFAKEKAIMGFNQYFKFADDRCSPEARYVVVGTPIAEKAAAIPANCGCGNGVCGVDESEFICPSDCARIEAPRKSLLDLIFAFVPFRTLLISGILLLLAAVLASHTVRERMHKKKEARLAEVIEEAKKALAENKLNEAMQANEKISQIFNKSPKHVRAKHDEAVSQVNAEIAKRMQAGMQPETQPETQV